MSKAFAESCCRQAASLLMILGTRTEPVEMPVEENSAISTTGAGPLGTVVANGARTACTDHAAMAATAALPLNRKARRVIFCRSASSFRSESNIAKKAYWTQIEPRSYSPGSPDLPRRAAGRTWAEKTGEAQRQTPLSL